MKTVSFVLNDGRSVGLRIYGAPNGFPVMFLHGNLNSRLFEPRWQKTEKETIEAGVQVYAFDRPGYGLSTFNPNGTYATFAQDVGQVASKLGLEKFAVLGYSSGGPHALACATALEPRVVACGMVASDGPYKHMGEEWEMKTFGSLEHRSNPIGVCRKNAEELRSSYEGIPDEVKRAIALADIDEATKQGLGGASRDSVLETGDWEGTWDKLGNIQCPMQLWHGVNDETVSMHCSEFIFNHLNPSTAKLELVQGENHTIIRRMWKPMLETLVEQASVDSLSIPSEQAKY